LIAQDQNHSTQTCKCHHLAGHRDLSLIARLIEVSLGCRLSSVVAGLVVSGHGSPGAGQCSEVGPRTIAPRHDDRVYGDHQQSKPRHYLSRHRHEIDLHA
jgi:hypothetical protein